MYTLHEPAQWAQMEFGLAHLGDRRLTNRLVGVACALAKCPSGTLPQAFPEWSELKGAYRFFSNPNVRYEEILAPHWERTRQRCTESGEYLLLEDTTDLDYSSHEACEGLGPLSAEFHRGLKLHSTLAVRVEAWDLNHCPEVTVVGVAAQKCWVRSGPTRRQKKESRRQQMQRRRESQRWTEVLSLLPPRPEAVTWIYIADREADIYEAYERCLEHRIDLIIRANHDRRLVEEERSLFEVVGQGPVLGSLEVEVRARPGRKARIAQVQIRAAAVTLNGVWRVGGYRPGLAVNAVEAREINAPAGEEPIDWVLLTSLPVKRFVEARRIVTRYAKRWVIEEFHKALKSGANVEKSQLERAERLQALVAILVVVAVRLLNAKMLARTHPEAAVNVEAFGPEPLQILTARFGQPKGGWNYGNLLVAIARLGGFLAQRSDGDPGWITIWRGWQRLMAMTEGAMTCG